LHDVSRLSRTWLRTRSSANQAGEATKSTRL
jgi:hypothetical protein